ncbi:MAG TPA: signal peptide peptidase SppA, partial [Myxococcaceae bacterium]|nr:signal peptide peptidase SppA [Myxococcaceae bacterium]
DEATAPLVNPAGLMQVRSAQLFYGHERSVARNDVIDGLYLSNTLLELLAVGVSVEWIRNSSLPALSFPDRRKTTWSLALGSPSFALGAAFSFFSSEENSSLDHASGIDLGLLIRPSRVLSIGAVVKNVNAPQLELASLPRSYDLGFGVRPFGDAFTVGLDYLLDDSSGLGGGRLSWVVQGAWRGLILGAGVTHGFDASPGDLGLQLSLTWNLPNFGVTYATGSAGGGLDHTFLARISTGAYPAFGRPAARVSMIDLTSELTRGRGAPLALLGVSETDAYLRLTRLLSHAERDPDLRGVVVKLEALPEVGLGRAEELRQSLMRLRRAGKTVVAFLLAGGDSEYLVATGADRILLVPQSMLLVNGLAANVSFFGGAMQKLGVQWDVARVGAYKNAPDAFTRTEMSAEQRQTINAYLDEELRHLVSAIAEARKLTPAQVQAAMREGLFTPKRAQELGLIDGIVDPAAVDETLEALMPGTHFDGRYALEARERRSWGRSRKIALVPVVGTIASGKSREDPLGFAEIAGSETVIRAVKAAEEDPDVAAIVLRIDSGGGDALASDLMYRAVLAAKKTKPVIASMGDVAASGGYYAAMGANRVFATPATVTGSIGVFVMKPAVSGLAEKLGIRQETIKRGELSTLLGFYRPWTDAERAAAQKWVDSFYDDFISEVARSRNLDKQRVDELARGRVWSGVAAKERGLVDELGTLHDAIDAAAKAGGIPAGEPYELAIMGEPRGLMGALSGSPLAAALPAPEPLPPAVRSTLDELGVPPSVFFEPGAHAVMPFRLVVK